MKNKKHNSDVYMMDVFYEKNKKRAKSENNEPKKVKYFRLALKVVLVVAALVSLVAFWPAGLIKPEPAASGDTVLMNIAPDAEPVENDGRTPDEAVWKENVTPIAIDDMIYMAWDDPSNKNWTLTEMPPNINVLAPVWFKLKFTEDKKGVDFIASDISTSAFDYVKTCHDNDVQVWGVVQCIDYALSELIVEDAAVQKDLIDQIILWMTSYDLDGINLDFENMNPDNKQLFNDFARQLKTAMPEGKPLSSCITVKLISESAENNPWQAYDRGGMAQVMDYITVMTYDEHKDTSKKPVASIDWVDLHIRRLLEEIPSEKLILGIPFHGVDYRAEVVNPQTMTVNPIWNDSGHTTTIFMLNLLLETGRYNYKGTEIVLEYWLNKGGWDADLGVSDYSFVDTKGIQHTIWIDDENSIYQKTSLAYDYHLAGVAIWKKNLGTEAMFEAVARAAAE